MYHDMDGWWVVWGAVMMIVFWGGLITFGVWTVRSFLSGQSSSALDIARERFARGEINAEEFENIKRGLAT